MQTLLDAPARLSADHRDADTENLQRHAMTAGAAFFDELRRDFDRHVLPRQRRGDTVEEIVAAAQHVLDEYTDPLATILSDSTLAAWLRGAGRVAKLLHGFAPLGGERTPPPHAAAPTPASEESPPELVQWEGMKAWLPMVEEAAKALDVKQVFPKDEYEALSDEAKLEAFTVAREQTTEAIGKIKDAVSEAVVNGDDFSTFKDKVDEALATSTLGPGHMENVFRTAVAQSYADGQDRVHSNPVVAEVFPYVESLPIDDSRITDLCWTIAHSGLDGTGVYRVDDPTWRKFRNPRHWRCRCGRNYLTVEQAARRGVREAMEWHRSGRPPVSPQYVTHPPVELPKGWTPGGGVRLSFYGAEPMQLRLWS